MKKIILNVPLVRQEKDSVECGIAGLCMILKYYGKNIGMKELKDNINTDELGTYAPQLGKYMMRQGFNIEIITMHPRLFTLRDNGMTQKNILKRLIEVKKEGKGNYKKVSSLFIEYIKAGGRITPKVPSKEDIIKELKHNRPVAALLTTNFLIGKKPRFNFHFNIITGIDDKNIYVNDPMWDERGGKHKYKIEDFFYGLFASAYGDMDNASLMFFKR